MMKPFYVNKAVMQAVPFATHERVAVLKRLAEIAVAIGHPMQTAKQSATLVQERTALERSLAPNHRVSGSDGVQVGYPI